MLTTIAIMLLALMVTVSATADWKMPEFMIYVWGEPRNEAEMQVYAEANFNVVDGSVDKLDLCRKYGLKLMVRPAVSPDIASQLADDPTVWGYFIVDEPGNTWSGDSVDLFKQLSAKVKALHEADPNHPAYINLGWLSWSGDYLRNFIKTIRPEILSYDYYQWWAGGGPQERAAYFARLKYFRAAALSAGIPFACWMEGNANPAVDGRPSAPHKAEKLRQSVYTSLAYGVKGIEWFRAVLIFDRDEAAGATTLTPSGKDIAALNAELKRIGPILAQLRSTDVFHTPPLPSETRELPADYWIQTETPDLVLGMFQDDMRSNFILVVNRDYQQERQAALRFLRPVSVVEKFDKQTGKWITLPLGKVAKLALGPADGELLKVSNSEAD